MPHEWMRIGAYKLLGKQYRYHTTKHQIVCEEELTFNQQLFSLLLPLIIGTGIALIIVAVWLFSFAWVQVPRRLPDYLWQAPLWHHALHLAWIVLLAYTLISSCNDVICASRLVRQQQRHQ